MLPFLSDTTANWLDLFRRVGWWDDVSHFAPLVPARAPGSACSSRRTCGRAGSSCRWSPALGAVLALGWELGEYALFIRSGKEAGGAYRDTLGDETLGTTRRAGRPGCWSVVVGRRREIEETLTG